jgi:hypothetical protein
MTLPSQNLWLDLTSNRIQIYRNANTSQSFLWLHKGPPPVSPRAPVALTGPLGEMQLRPKVDLVPKQDCRQQDRVLKGPYKRDSDGDAAAGAVQRGPAGRVGGGRGGRDGRDGRPAAARSGDPYVRVSIATIEIDRKAFGDGQLRKVRHRVAPVGVCRRCVRR